MRDRTSPETYTLVGRKYSSVGRRAGMSDVVLYRNGEQDILLSINERKVWVNAKDLLAAVERLNQKQFRPFTKEESELIDPEGESNCEHVHPPTKLSGINCFKCGRSFCL